MTRLFTSLYLGLLATLYIFMIVAHLINTYLYVDIENIIKAENFAAEITLLEELDNHIALQRRQKLIDVIAEKNQIIISLVSLDSIPSHIQKALESQPAWFDDEEYDYFKAFSPTQYYQIEEDETHHLLAIDETVGDAIFIALICFIASGCFIWLFGLHRKLKRLESTLVDISQGNLSARASTQKRFQIGQLNTCLNTMAEQMEGILGSHKQLTHVIAHEFRSPLFRMQMILEMLITAKKDNVMVHVKGLEDEIFCLEDLVEELLSYAKMERAELKLQLEQVNLADFLQNLQEKFSIECKASLQWHNHLDDESNILLDKSLTERAITNLVKNADKYGESEIYVCIDQIDGSMVVCVEDNGMGIPVSQQATIFEPFHQVSDASQSIGFGLGLAIVKEIAQLHGGTITVADSEYGGAKFILTLPVKA
ncbi:ATP-binding protein [Cognaticolwellia mytili]|uniref:ATP-binding protein n=1 Tax=Cognaticolwellia mytili TaxID=1888913 RepID=UPI000A17824D|nr:ATP-binding protein [Cognaticolwellia mytili]